MTSNPSIPANLDVSPCIEGWRAKLLDFSGRNRALFFRPTRSTLIVNLPELELWNQLNANEVVDLPLEFFLQDLPRGDERAARAGDDLRRKIKNLQATARTFVEEQGVHVLHMPVGWLTWPDEGHPAVPGEETVTIMATGRTARVVRSPLLFVPVSLQNTTRGWRLRREEDVGIEANLTLLGFLQTLNIDVEIDDEDELDATACLETLREAVHSREHFSVAFADSSTVDTFSFKKVAMLRELERSADLIAAQPVLRALCGDTETLLASANPRDYDPLDETVRPEDIALAIDADSSQLKAILAVVDGASLVIQGPPGTGKSQTITNLISTAVARGKKVLFVAEKKAARDVVVDNLTSSNLDDLVLHITEEVVSGRSVNARRDVAEQFRVILEKGPGKYPLDDGAPRDFKTTRGALNTYDSHLHTRLSGLSFSTPFELLQHWATCNQDLLPSQPVSTPSVREIDDGWFHAVKECAYSLDDIGPAALDRAREPWLRMNPASDLDQRLLKEALDRIVATPAQIQAIADQVGFKCDTWTDENAARLAQALFAMETLAHKTLLSFLSPKVWRASSAVKALVAQGGRVVSNAAELRTSLSVIQNDWLSAYDVANSVYALPSSPLEATSQMGQRLLSALPSYSTARTTLRVIGMKSPDAVATSILMRLLEIRLPGQSLGQLLDVVLSHAWADEAYASAAEFSLTTSAAQARMRQQFVDADAALQDYSLYMALNAFAPNRPSMETIAPLGSELHNLRAQVTAKRRKPLRWLFSNAAGAILRLKPVMVASPLAVAQFLSNRAYKFDLVIFDEASQIPTADAVVAMSRGKQVVVVGDSQQMPPTSFFNTVLGAAPAAITDFDFESVLQECNALLPARKLLNHYRSQDERLIAFSNHFFYGGSLITYPSSWTEHPDLGVKFVYLPNAVYGRGGNQANSEEAEKVIELLRSELEKDPEADVGVTAMSQAQQAEIQARLEAAADGRPELEDWLAKGRVKNLETIQGDECDVMILSFGYGKDVAGNLQLNFGPLSQDNGYRRLNVAITRARRKTVVVSSIRAADIPTTIGAGGRVVRQYLDYAERGTIVLSAGLSSSGVDQYDSPFEQDVASELRNLGWPIDTQVGVGKYRIDLGVRDPALPGRYIAGIECDGATYHGAATARDRDIVRQQVLERLGWRILRVWSPDWFRDHNAVLSDLDQALKDAMGVPVETVSKPGFETHEVSDPPETVAFQASSSMPDGTVLYRPHVRAVSYPTMAMDDWAAHIVHAEGPLHEEELMAALRDDYGYGSLGARIRAQFDGAIRNATRRELVIAQGSWYWPPRMTRSNVPVRLNRGTRRRFDFCCDEELERAILMAAQSAGRLTPAQLVEATSRLLGFRQTDQVQTRLTSLVSRATASGLLRRVDTDVIEAT